MKFLVLGSSGQICRALIKSLASLQDSEIWVVSRSDSKYSDLSQVRYFKVLSYDIDFISDLISDFLPSIVIYTLACGSVRANNDSSADIFQINLHLPTQISKVLASYASQKFLFLTFGSTSQYQGCHNGTIIAEDTIPCPTSEYAITKTISYNQLTHIAQSASLLTHVNIVLSSVYGGAEHQSRLIPQIISSLFSSTVTYVTDSSNQRDYVSVYDVIRVILKVIESYLSHCPDTIPTKIICASGFRFTNLELAFSLYRLFGESTSRIIVKKSRKSIDNFSGLSLSYDNRLARMYNSSFSSFDAEVKSFFQSDYLIADKCTAPNNIISQ